MKVNKTSLTHAPVLNNFRGTLEPPRSARHLNLQEIRNPQDQSLVSFITGYSTGFGRELAIACAGPRRACRSYCSSVTDCRLSERGMAACHTRERETISCLLWRIHLHLNCGESDNFVRSRRNANLGSLQVSDNFPAYAIFECANVVVSGKEPHR